MSSKFISVNAIAISSLDIVLIFMSTQLTISLDESSGLLFNKKFVPKKMIKAIVAATGINFIFLKFMILHFLGFIFSII